ncbi:hypothetical protein RJ641_016549 [Dillenia turbinata]|uniref:Eukaryotic translation initiation factor 3 subunit B n=1 Tax=Dillenia turbinata TaxID=194707 RepID=A0AAN8UWJ6_9MAGN
MADVMSVFEERAARLGIDLSQVDFDSIRLPPGEDFGIISDDEDLKEVDQLEFEQGFDNIIVVDNLPVVPSEKFDKLVGVIRKIYSQIGTIKEDELWMPVDASGKTLGYCFIEYITPLRRLSLPRRRLMGTSLTGLISLP